MGEAENLRAILDSRGIALMSPVRTTAVDLGNIIGFSSMHIPRFVTWGGIREILGFLDLFTVNWYGKQLEASPPRHKNPLLL